MTNKYTANDIETLEFKEAIRKRIAMYLGDAGMNGVYQAIREIITNSIDEYTVGYGDKIEITLNENTVTIKDNARGVPFGTRSDGTDSMVAIYTSAHTGGKFDNKIYQNVAGLNGIGAKATALSSSSFIASSFRDGEVATLTLKDGVVNSFDIKKDNTKSRGTTVTFTPSQEVFHLENINIDFNEIKSMCEIWAYLSPGLTFSLVNETKGNREKIVYSFKNGIKDLLKNSIKKPLHQTVLFKEVEDESGNKVQVAMQWTKERKEVPFVFTNGLENINGGTSLTGAKTALTRSVNNIAGVKLSGESVRTGLFYIVSASVPSPSFSDQTKTKVNNPELRSLADKAVSEALKEFSVKNPKEWDTVISILIKEEKAEKAAEAAREKILSAEKEINEATRRGNIALPEKAVDATNKTGYRELYLTEGDSASSWLKTTRDSATQAIMPLRGKILNTYDLDLVEAYDNQEVKDIFTLIGSGAGPSFNLSKAKYSKIIMAVDGDDDGSHISLLLTALFLAHAPQLIEDGRLYRVQAPFYGVNTPKGYKMLYSDKELEEYESKHGKQKVDRFKGLGALNEDLVEKYLISDERKLVQVKMDDLNEMRDLFDILMGRNIEARRKLVSEGEIE